MSNYRNWLSWIVMLALVAPLPLPAQSTKSSATQATELLPSGLNNSIDRGLAFLQQLQKPDGSFESSGSPSAATGLALLAFLSAGQMPDVGRHGVLVRKAIDYLLALNPEGGYYGRDGGKMYGHCIVTVALAEACGMEADETQRLKVRTALERALAVILTAQNSEKKQQTDFGGWHDEPQASESNLMATASCVVTLRACQSAGLVVPKSAADGAAAYVLRCYRPDQKGFSYQIGGDASVGMTGAGVLSLYMLDGADRGIIEPASGYLVEKSITESARYYYLITYYACQAALQTGKPTWDAVWKRAYEQLLSAQRMDDGSWPPRSGDAGGEDRKSRLYSTSMSVLTLAIPLRLLPIYQR